MIRSIIRIDDCCASVSPEFIRIFPPKPCRKFAFKIPSPVKLTEREMTDFWEMYKRVGFGQDEVDTNRAWRSQNLDKTRREVRGDRFNARREIDVEGDCLEYEEEGASRVAEDDASGAGEAKKNEDDERYDDSRLPIAVQERLLQLAKWKEERCRRKLEERKRAKPVFKVGIVHDRMYSPRLVRDDGLSCRRARIEGSARVARLCRCITDVHFEPLKKRITRATEKRLAAKALKAQRKRENLRAKRKLRLEIAAKNESEEVSFVSKDHKFKGPDGIEEIPLFGSLALLNHKKEGDNYSIFKENLQELTRKLLSDEVQKNS